MIFLMLMNLLILWKRPWWTFDSQNRDYQDSVVVKDYVSDDDEVSIEKQIPRIFEDQIFEDSKDFTKVLKEKGIQFLEQNDVLYPKF